MNLHDLFLVLLLSLFSFFCGQVSSDYSWMREKNNVVPSHVREPEFEDTPLSISVQPGQTAILPCRVRYIADKLVSWIRRKDLHIISSGSLVFTGDSRFQLFHPEGDSASWALQLRNPVSADQGLYECQVNTEPKMKRSILLTVKDMYPAIDYLSMRDDSSTYGQENAEILGPGERYVKEGSTVSLTCHIKAARTLPHQRPLRFVDWMFQDTPITSEVRVAGVSVDTEKIGRLISSVLTLDSVTRQDSGIYSCTSPFSSPASIVLIVVDEDRSEAMVGEPLRSFAGSLRAGVTLALLLALLSMHH